MLDRRPASVAYTLARLVVALSVAATLWACGESAGADANPDEGATVRWVQNFDAAELMGLARHPDGVVALDSSDSLWAFSADGARRWTVLSEGAVNFGTGSPYPQVLVTDAGVTYLRARLSASTGTVGGRAIDCPPSGAGFCEALAAIDASGELRWVETLPEPYGGEDRGWTVVGERVVVVSQDLTLRAWSAGDGESWVVTPRLPDGAGSSFVLQADGADALWLVSRHADVGGCDRGVRFAWLRFAAADGEQTTTMWSCEGAGLLLDDGRVVHLREVGAKPTLESVDGDEPWRLSLPEGYGAVPVEGGQVGLYAAGRGPGVGTSAGIGPVALADASGVLRWQWPGKLHDGAISLQPSGLCRGLVAGAPDGDLYVATQACAGARALLDASGSKFDDASVLVARIHVYGSEPPRCGNGWLDPDEECDQADFQPVLESSTPGTYLDGRACASFFDTGGWQGDASCTADCMIDTETCESTCGNGQLDPDEQCDGSLRTFMDGSTCPGTRLITACIDCRYDASDCPEPPPPPPPDPTCGNRKLDPGEDCDGDVFLWQSPCDEYFAGQATGPALCGSDCLADISQCSVCVCTDCVRPPLCP